jgi:hypothetical protein
MSFVAEPSKRASAFASDTSVEGAGANAWALLLDATPFGFTAVTRHL